VVVIYIFVYSVPFVWSKFYAEVSIILNHYPTIREVYKARMFVEVFAFKSTGLTYFVNFNERRF
jgi:hypothetical protein